VFFTFAVDKSCLYLRCKKQVVAIVRIKNPHHQISILLLGPRHRRSHQEDAFSVFSVQIQQEYQFVEDLK
jgi:hypothetical protein